MNKKQQCIAEQLLDMIEKASLEGAFTAIENYRNFLEACQIAWAIEASMIAMHAEEKAS